MTRPAPLAVALALLVVATLAVRPLLHGLPATTLAAFWATALGQLLVPGMLLARGARLVTGDRWLLLGQGATLGLALQGLALLAGRALSAPWLPTLVALAAAGLGLWLARRDAALDPAHPEAAAAPAAPRTHASGLTLGVVLVAVLLQPLASAERLSAPYPFDMLFHAGNAAELRHRWPLEDPRVAGVPLNYHMLAYALPVAAAELADAPVADPVLALAPLFLAALVALQATNAGRVLFGSVPAGALGAAVLLLHVDPGAFLGLAPGAFNSHLATGVYGSPTTVCGLILLAGLVVALGAWLERPRFGRLAALFLLGLGASAAKTTVLPVTLAGIGLGAVLALLRGRRAEAKHLALALAALLAAGMPLTVWQTGGEDGYVGIVGMRPAMAYTSSAFARLVAAHAASGLPGQALVAAGFLPWLAGYLGLAGVGSALWLARRRAPPSTLQAVGLGAIAAGLLLALVLDVPGLSQLFLLYNGQLLLALFAGACLHELPGWSRTSAPALAGVALLLLFALPSAVQLVSGARASLAADAAAAGHDPTPLERDYAAGLAWLRAHGSRDAVVFADNPSLLLSALGEVRLYYENGTYTARALRAPAVDEPWPERAALQQRLLRRPDAAALGEARLAVGAGRRLLIAADSVQPRIEAGFVHPLLAPVPPRRFFPYELFELAYGSDTLQVYEAREQP